MKKTLLFLFLIAFSAIFSQTSKKVFFIGNSYTYFNDLPALIQDIAQSTGDILEHQSQTPGGSTLQQHVNSTTVTTLMQGNWDYVVLQEQSQLPSFTDQQVQNLVYPYAAQLSDLIKSTNGCGNVIFYMTWGRKNGDDSRCNVQPSVCTYEGMDDLISQHYIEMAKMNEALLSPVGKVWRTIRQLDPAMELYDQDKSHPSYIGSMAAAYTFYAVIFKKDPTLAPYNGNLTAAEAQFIKNTVKDVVYDSMDPWNILSNDVYSRFKYEFTGGFTVKFTNKSKNATTYLWDFGDGTTSTLENPEHTYSAQGNYNVQLTTNACGGNSTKTKLLPLGSLSTKETDIEDPAQIYPNPTQNFITIITRKKAEILSLTDASGRMVSYLLNTTDSGYTVQLHHLSAGVYFLKYKTGEKEFTKKIIKK
ncbi:PKD domain-containing protein [Chryseobacterium sp. BIGb0232]|uniref:PKD domain-containing protein n=1 Tax=Chryseobacterium sp. BIGb0232 TaxID=2940598 RepID=UPI000FA0C3B5|nr:PKD domain-containing protein [Chryseobacterium sp. BIGb0232]MCS4305025.1 PKD repeat protein [Chryseobacterium sp. BIGb0232]ROS08159.1 putative secreted protein (Por secretion system target) [Chryseobacterium nakagawai]